MSVDGGHGLVVQPVDGLLESVDPVEALADHEGVAIAELSLEGLGELADLVTQTPAGEVGKHCRIAFPLDEGSEHRAAGDAGDLGGYRG